ncbi:MAG: hypothetical protein ACON4Y_05480 [Flavobacteriales bacterium]
MLQISTQYSLAWLIVCLLVSFAISYWLYRKTTFTKRVSSVLFLLRFLTIFILCFLLLKPFLNFEVTQEEKPIVVFAVDNSESMIRGKDSLFLKNELSKKIEQFRDNNIDQFDIQSYTFGSNSKKSDQFDFRNKRTDISQLISEINDRYSNRNLSAFILVSDGLYNQGLNPNYQPFLSKAPFYTVGVGDTVKEKDVSINYLFHNDLAFKGNTFPLNVNVKSSFYKGRKTKVNILNKDKLIDSKEILINSDEQLQTISFLIKADEVGLQEYKVIIESFSDEKNTLNNQTKAYIDVLESKQKILLLTEITHPDISAISKALSNNQNIDLSIKNKSDFDGDFSAYNLLIAYQTNLENIEIPTWHFVGQNSNSSSIPWLNYRTNQNIEEVSPSLESFSLFELNSDWKTWVKKLPPLYISQADYVTQSQTLLSQTIKGIEFDEPILSFNNLNGMRQAVFIGEGLWRWRINEFKFRKNHNLFDELINKSVQYLVLSDDKRLFRLKAKKKIFENEPFDVSLDFYNSNYELITDVEVSFKLIDDQKNEFDYNFDITNSSYELQIDQLPIGDYEYIASAIRNNEQFNAKGKLKVTPLQLEQFDEQHKHEVLVELSQNNNGTFFYLNEINSVFDQLNTMDKKSVLYTKTNLNELINSKWISIFLFVFLSLEWIIRKFNNNI